MKSIRLIQIFFLLALAFPALAQFYPEPVSTQSDKFINKSGIEWASYANDTTRFDKVNLSELLRRRFHKGEIKASFAVGSGTSQANKIIFVKKSVINGQMLYPGPSLPLYDSSGNIEKIYDGKPTSKVDSNIMNLVSLTQIFYIENKKLQSYILWVAPQLAIYTSNGVHLGNTGCFNTCFNFNYNFKSPATDKLVFLGTTYKKINLDSLQKNDRLKELYGNNLIETLWKDLPGSGNKMINIETGDRVNLNKLNTFSISIPVSIPVYDSLGNVIYEKSYREPTSPSIFKEIEIRQNWFYDYTKNILVNNIPEITLFLEKFMGIDSATEIKPALKIFFK